MATVYIVPQPLIGAMRSKAIYRLIGTLIGAAATVAASPLRTHDVYRGRNGGEPYGTG
jgi:uncharacterized membrane protein YccC